MPYYHLAVVTPQGRSYDGDVIHALVPGETGFVGVLANHAPFVTSSAGGRLEITEKEGLVKKFTVGPGFFEVMDNQAVLLTQSFKA
jgi:F-type H+-transporting ATPase subunit epsilon